MRFCKKCLYPDIKPQVNFDKNGICDACVWVEKKEKIEKRRERKRKGEKGKGKDDMKGSVGNKKERENIEKIKENLNMM